MQVAEAREDWRDLVTTSVLELAARDDDANVLWSVAGALGRCADVRAVPVLCDLAGHEDADIRFAVTRALPFVMDDDPSGDAVDKLLELAGDAEDDIREWAMFGLGSLGFADSREIRLALRRGLDDPCEAVRVEAIHGLARRGDMTVLPLVAALLSEDDPRSLTFNAAEYLAHPDLAGLLSRFDSDDPGIRRAVMACDPRLRSSREQACYALVAGVQAEFDQRRNGFSAALACPLLDPDLDLIVATETNDTFGAFDVLRQGPTIDSAIAHVLRASGITSGGE